MPDDSNEIYWDTFFVKVEDKLFCVPRYEFVRSSEVFADMFLLPSGPAARSEGQDRSRPIFLEGYKKDEFTCLLKVMYPTATSLISGANLELHLKIKEWVSVLKLSTIWNMTKIRQYAIYRLTTDGMLSLIEKFLLGRAHGVSAWLYEAVINLVTCNPLPTFEDLAALGWETVARILWIRNDDRLRRFNRDAIKCKRCSSSLNLREYESIYRSVRCGCVHIESGDAELTFLGLASPILGTIDFSVPLNQIQCLICKIPFCSIIASCKSCLYIYHYSTNPAVRVNLNNMKTMIEEMFGEEMKDHEPVPVS